MLLSTTRPNGLPVFKGIETSFFFCFEVLSTCPNGLPVFKGIETLGHSMMRYEGLVRMDSLFLKGLRLLRLTPQIRHVGRPNGLPVFKGIETKCFYYLVWIINYSPNGLPVFKGIKLLEALN